MKLPPGKIPQGQLSSLLINFQRFKVSTRQNNVFHDCQFHLILLLTSCKSNCENTAEVLAKEKVSFLTAKLKIQLQRREIPLDHRVLSCFSLRSFQTTQPQGLPLSYFAPQKYFSEVTCSCISELLVVAFVSWNFHHEFNFLNFFFLLFNLIRM